MLTQRVGIASLVAITLFSCATPQVTETDPHKLLAEACAPGVSIKGVTGGVAMKAASKEASGQFPATVDARSPGWLKLEIQNLIGGTEAVISVQNRTYKIEVPGKPER